MHLEEHLEKLKYFYEVAKLGSMKKASEAVFITQPSLTKSMKVLEESIGNPLFTRLPRGVKLTVEGEILFQYCHDLFASITDVEQRLAHPHDLMAGSLRLGTYDSIGIYFWPKFLRKFLPSFPQLNLEMSTGRSSEIQQKLENGQLDIALIIEPKPSDNIIVEELVVDNFKLYQSTRTKRVYDTIDEAPLIFMGSAIAGHQSLQNTLETHGHEKRRLYNTSSLESVKELTLNGIGIGLLPKMVAKDSISKKKLEEVKISTLPKKGIGQHRVGLAYQKARKESVLIQTLVKEIKKSW